MIERPIHVLQWGMTSNQGGVESFILSLHRAMDPELVKFDYLLNHDDGPIAYEDEIHELGGRVFRVMYSRRESVSRSRTCLMDFFAKHPEISGIHMHANFPYAAPLGYAKKSGIGMRILHSHNTARSGVEHGILNKTLATVRKVPVRYGISAYPTAYFACSPKAADFMFPGKPYSWIKNGIAIDRFRFNQSKRSLIRADFGFEASDVVMGFCGRLDGQKNPLFLIDIFAAFIRLNPHAKLLVVGHGGLRNDMENKCHAYGIADKVIFAGGNRSDVNDLYQAMDVFVLPSTFEGLPITAIEAQCSGLPCFVSSEAVPEETDVTGLVKFISIKQDPATWAEEIATTLRAATNGNRNQYANKVKVAGFDMQDVAQKMQQYYLEHASRK